MEAEGFAYEQMLRQGGDRALREASAFFDARGLLRQALRRLAERLAVTRIPYALLGDLALFEHGYRRFTEGIDLVMTPAALARFRDRFIGRGYRPAFDGAQKRFRDTETGVRIEVVTTGEYPGDGLPKEVSFPDPDEPGTTVEIEGVRVVTLETLIELKLASGTSAPHRLRDLADVQDLIVRLALPLSFADELDPSVRTAYHDLWHRAHEGRSDD